MSQEFAICVDQRHCFSHSSGRLPVQRGHGVGEALSGAQEVVAVVLAGQQRLAGGPAGGSIWEALP